MEGDTTGTINFFSHTIDGCAPNLDATPTLGWTKSNYVQVPTQITIHDLRGKEDLFNLDTNGFEVHKYDGAVHDEVEDNSDALSSYYDEIREVLKKRLGASRVIVFNHITRSRGPPRPADQCDASHKNPVLRPHVDNDPPSARLKMKECLDEQEAKQAMEKRFQIINIWRPLGGNPIIDTPLTICDYTSLDPDNDIHVSQTRGTKASASIYVISRNRHDTQKWYYLSQMRSNEMFVFKIFDNKPDVARFGAHTAFINESVPPTNTERCSIEVRCLVLYE